MILPICHQIHASTILQPPASSLVLPASLCLRCPRNIINVLKRNCFGTLESTKGLSSRGGSTCLLLDRILARCGSSSSISDDKPIPLHCLFIHWLLDRMNKDLAIRRRILNIYNKREEDFPSLRDYNDYLEEVEDMIFKLIDGEDVPAIESKIKLYQEEHADQIIANNARKAEERSAALRKQPAQTSANTSTMVATSEQTSGIYAPAIAPGSVFVQPKPAVVLSSHDRDLNEDEETRKQRQEKGAKAGGWTPELGRRRAFEEAFASLWVG